MKFNLDRQNASIHAFEVGHIHFKEGEGFRGEPAAGIVLTGRSAPYHFETKPEEVDFFHLKGHVEDLLASLGVARRFEISHLHNFHPGRQARVYSGDADLGALGEVHPRHLRTLGINQRVFYAELNLHDLLKLVDREKKVTPLANYPGSERDWTITLDRKAEIGPILNMIKGLESTILENVFLLDIYTSEKLGSDSMNVSFRLSYRDRSKTIASEDVEKEHKRITEHIAEKLRNVVR